MQYQLMQATQPGTKKAPMQATQGQLTGALSVEAVLTRGHMQVLMRLPANEQR